MIDKILGIVGLVVIGTLLVIFPMDISSTGVLMIIGMIGTMVTGQPLTEGMAKLLKKKGDEGVQS